MSQEQPLALPSAASPPQGYFGQLAAATKGSSLRETAPASVPPGLRVQLAHDWLLGMRGGEWLLAELLPLFPAAGIQTLFYDPRALAPALNGRSIHPSLLNRLPAVQRYYRWLLPAFPAVAARHVAAPCDVLLATSHCAAHGLASPPGARRIHYYFSPMRYLYDQAGAYAAGNAGRGLGNRLLELAAPALRRWDAQAAHRTDAVWAISKFVADRIERVWGLEAQVIYPPVRTEFFVPPTGGAARVDEDLVVSALVPYKRVDLAIEAANRLRRPLRVAGGGPLLGALRRLAGSTVTVEGPVSDARLRELYQTRRLLIFPGVEDFGIVPLEAMACGMPVLALRAGGLLETLPEGACGEFFDQPTVESLADAWGAIDTGRYLPSVLRAQAEQFAPSHFRAAVARGVAELLKAG